MSKLTNNAVSTMISQGSGKGDRFIVEAYNVKDRQDYLKFQIRDTTTSIKAAIHITRPELSIVKVCKNHNNQGRYLIKVTEFVTHYKDNRLMIQVINFEPLNDNYAPPPKIQESPKNIFKKEIKQEEKLGMRTQKKQSSNNRKPIQSTSFIDYNMERRDDEFEDVTDEQLRQFEKISDLYIDFQGRWEIVVRVIEKSYRQFTSKSNKLTKIFTMTLIDRTGMKIEGTMFGDNAKEYHELIKLNHVYRMSRGQVRQENYNQSKPKQFSRYNIIFSKNSIFIPIKEIKSIPRGHEIDNTIEQIILSNDFDRVFSVTAILLQIGEQRSFEKEQRIIYKKTLLIGDPQSKKSVQVTIWNKDLYIDSMWIQKSVLLKNFKLSNYRDSISFNSTFKSEIILKQNHKFSKFEGKYQKEQYDLISERRQEKGQQKERTFRTIKQIQNELMYINTSEALVSELQVWLTHMAFKNKWFYDACNNPKCKKQATSNQKCFHCGHNNGTAQRRFILPIQLSDWTGSIWATAFDQFSNQIFKGQSLDQLAKMQESRLKEEAECRLYQQFKLKISSKKQAQGNVKHSIIGKASEVNIERASISNIEKIKRALF